MFERIMSSKGWWRLFQAYGLVFLIFLYLPLALIFVYSFNANPINMAVWTEFTFDWYKTIFFGAGTAGSFDAAFTESPDRIFEVVRNSAIVALSASTISTVIGTATAIAIRRYDFVGKKVYQALLVLPMIVPDIVLGIALLIFFVGAGFELSLLTVIIGHTTFLSSYVFVVVSARLAGMDMSLERASADLGAGPLTTFRRRCWRVPAGIHHLARRRGHHLLHRRRRLANAAPLHPGNDAPRVAAADQCAGDPAFVLHLHRGRNRPLPAKPKILTSNQNQQRSAK